MTDYFTGLMGCLLAVAALWCCLPDNARAIRSESQGFQTVTGGLGLGPALNLAECSLAFDPRLGNVCDANCGPLIAGGFFCSRHAHSVFYLSPIPAVSARTDR